MAFNASKREFLVNTHTDDEQSNPGIGANPATGGFQVVWQSDRQDGSFWGVFGQNFKANGKTLGKEISIADLTVGDQENPDVAFDEDGNGMWVWQSTAEIMISGGQFGPPTAHTYAAANYRTRSKSFGFEEEVGGSEIYSNVELSRDGRWDADPVGKDAIEPSVISVGEDMFVTGWYRKDEDRAEFRYTVDQVSADHNKVISSQGDYSRGFAEAEKTDRVYTNFGDVELLRTIEDRRFGDLKEYLVVTTLASDLAGADGAIQFQIFQESISAGLAFKYGSNLATDYNDRFVLDESGTEGMADRPRATILEDGGFAIVWQERDEGAQKASDWHSDVYVQVFNDDLSERTGKIAVDTGKGDQTLPEIAALNDGGFAITWTDGNGKGDDVRLQRFNSDGWKLGEEVRANSKASGDQGDSVIATLSSGDVVVAWESSDGDASDGGVMARVFDATSVGKNSAQTIVATDANEKISTGKKDDTVDAAGGKDKVYGGSGKDKLSGSGGNDKLYGGTGNDELIGGKGKDKLYGEAGNDVLKGGDGNDEFHFKAGADVIKDFDDNKDSVVFYHSLVKGDLTKNKLAKMVEEKKAALVFDFGDGDKLTVKGISDFDDLRNDIDFA